MYIIAIAWIYVVLMMSITEASVVAGIMTFTLYGILPLTIVLYIMGTPGRRRRRVALEAQAREDQAATLGPALQQPAEPKPTPTPTPTPTATPAAPERN